MTSIVTRSAQKKRKVMTPTPQRPPRVLRTVSDCKKLPSGVMTPPHPISGIVPPPITASEIQQRMKLLFPEIVVDQVPCLSARIFAAYSLAAESTDCELPQKSTPPHRSTTCQTGSRLTIPPTIIQLLSALVLVEAVSLAPVKGGGGDVLEQSSPDDHQSRQMIHFCGMDCSAVPPPVDRVDGSHAHQQDSIQALLQAKEHVDDLVRRACCFHQQQQNSNDENHLGSDFSFTTPVVREIWCLTAVNEFLEQVDDSKEWINECAKAIHANYPPQRVVKAAEQYQTEFSIILHRLKGASSTNNNNCHLTTTLADATPSLVIEQCLSQMVGQAIRYNLRMFFNRAPPRLSPADTNWEQREQQYSQVYDLITMENDQENTAVDDDCIAALVSAALCSIHEFFGLDALLDPSTNQPNVPDLFCAQPASNFRFRPRQTNPTTLSAEELNQVLDDIYQAQSFLAAAAACRFLVQLWTTHGVQDEIRRQGGWEQLETYASISWKHQLWRLCPDDAHLVVLCNYQALLQRLQCYWQVLEPRVEGCERSLHALAQRFHTNTKSKNLLKKFPQIPALAQCLEEGWERTKAFPLVFASSPKDDE